VIFASLQNVSNLFDERFVCAFDRIRGEAFQVAPHDRKILAQLGRLNSETGNLSAAESALEQAVAIEPKRASLHFQLG
jgi:cytochrome c-type biogenesis protein CcmH/NrfG